MSRLSLALAPTLFIAGLSLFSSAASAAGYYDAKPATAPAEASMITSGIIWKCADGACSAPKTTSRDAIVCEQVVKRVGTLSTFSAGGTAFDEPALARCNARAK